MVNAEDAHIRPAAPPALLDDFRSRVEDVHERDGAGGDPFGRADHVAFRSEAAEGKTRPAAGLVNDAISVRARKIPGIESSTGMTKQAESWPIGRPAFISVGELGMKSSDDIALRNSSSQREASEGEP